MLVYVGALTQRMLEVIKRILLNQRGVESKLANRPYSAKEKKIKDVVVLREENR